ncbi:uncharacterized protein PAE49_015402 isoform 1-T1 [Odontesthes bonariensis]
MNTRVPLRSIIVITTLLLPLLIMLSAFFGWKMTKHKKTKPEACDVTMGSQTFDPDVLYATIDDIQNDHVLTENVTYSTISTKNNFQQKTAGPNESVIYSTLKNNEPE